MAETPKVVALDVLPEASRAIVREYFVGYECAFADSNDRAALLALVSDATVFLSSFGWINRELIEAAPGLRVIQKLGVGVDKFDLEAANDHGVVVFKAAGINAEAVAEWAVMLAIAVGRNLMKAVSQSREGRFEKEALRAESTQLFGKTIGLYGLGHIGRAVTKRFQAFGAKVIYYDLYRTSEENEKALDVRFVSFDDLLATADIISIHAPSTPETNGVFNARALAAMKSSAILINTARGELVDDQALADAIRSGQLRGAGLDVIANEPLSPESPLFDLDQVIITPHIAGATGDNFPHVIERAFENVDAALHGRELRPEDVVHGAG